MILSRLLDIFEWHMRGNAFGIHVDPLDGLDSDGADRLLRARLRTFNQPNRDHEGAEMS